MRIGVTCPHCGKSSRYELWVRLRRTMTVRDHKDYHEETVMEHVQLDLVEE